MLSEKPWKMDALVRLFGSVLVCVLLVSALAMSILRFVSDPTGMTMGAVVSIACAVILTGFALFLLQRRWPLERLVLYTAALLVAIYGSFFLIWLSARSSGGGVDPKRLGSTARIVIAVLSFQTIALFFVHRFVREHELSWSEAFGFKNDFSRALLTGIAAGCAAVPILIGLQYFSAALMNLVGIHPQEQEAVQLLRSSGGWLNRSIMGFTAVIIAPLAEEVLFRGILYPAIRQHGYPRLALWGGAVFFGAIHMNVATFIPLTIFAVALAWLYDRTRNLTTPVMAHLVFNMTNFIMLFALDLEHVPLNK
jgi:Predicted metal-dependent membrane protease